MAVKVRISSEKIKEGMAIMVSTMRTRMMSAHLPTTAAVKPSVMPIANESMVVMSAIVIVCPGDSSTYTSQRPDSTTNMVSPGSPW